MKLEWDIVTRPHGICGVHYKGTTSTVDKAWTTRSAHEKYKDFSPALQAGLTKIEEYYNRTSDSDTYMFAMHCVPLLTAHYYRSQVILL